MKYHTLPDETDQIRAHLSGLLVVDAVDGLVARICDLLDISEILIFGTNSPSSFWMAASLYTPPNDGQSFDVIRFVPTPMM